MPLAHKSSWTRNRTRATAATLSHYSDITRSLTLGATKELPTWSFLNLKLCGRLTSVIAPVFESMLFGRALPTLSLGSTLWLGFGQWKNSKHNKIKLEKQLYSGGPGALTPCRGAQASLGWAVHSHQQPAAYSHPAKATQLPAVWSLLRPDRPQTCEPVQPRSSKPDPDQRTTQQNHKLNRWLLFQATKV